MIFIINYKEECKRGWRLYKKRVFRFFMIFFKMRKSLYMRALGKKLTKIILRDLERIEESKFLMALEQGAAEVCNSSRQPKVFRRAF